MLLNVGRSLKLSGPQMFTKILFPAALPTIFVGVRLGLIFMLINVVGAGVPHQLRGPRPTHQRPRGALRSARHLCGDRLRDPGQRLLFRHHGTDRAMAEAVRLPRWTAPAAFYAQPVGFVVRVAIIVTGCSLRGR